MNSYTVIWHDPIDRDIILSIVMAADPNEAVVAAANERYGKGSYKPEEVELLCVCDGPVSKVFVEDDDRFVWFNPDRRPSMYDQPFIEPERDSE